VPGCPESPHVQIYTPHEPQSHASLSTGSTSFSLKVFSLNKCLLSASYVPDTTLESWDRSKSGQNEDVCAHVLLHSSGGQGPGETDTNYGGKLDFPQMAVTIHLIPITRRL
jgi:hypothetical protein